MYIDDSEIGIKKSIRQYFLPEYARAEQKKRQLLSKLQSVLRLTSIGAAVVGAAGAIGGPVLASSLLIFAVGAGVLGGAATGYMVARSIDRIYKKAALPFIEADIDNYKLVKRYASEALVAEKKAIEMDREVAQNTLRATNNQLDERAHNLKQKRDTTLRILLGGIDALQAQVRVSQSDIDKFRKEAETALGPDFAAAAPKPQVVVPVSDLGTSEPLVLPSEAIAKGRFTRDAT